MRGSWSAYSWSILLHAGLLALLTISFSWQQSRQAIAVPPLAIQATVIDEATLLAALSPVTPDNAARERQARLERERERQAERERAEAQRQAEATRQQRLEAERAAQTRLDEERAQQARLEQQRAEQAAADAAEQQRQAQAREKQAEQERQAREEQQRQQREAEAERQKQAEAERKRQVEAERQRLAAVQRQREAAKKAELEEQLRRALAEETARLEAEEAGLLDEYIALIKQRIVRNWIQPPGVGAGLRCELIVTQIPGGEVTGVDIISCNGDAAVRRSIEAAVYKASPLPPPADPRLFERKVRVFFEPDS
ncbi:MAG: cell envelope integrity protein TolA [Gammaproteobacteria bacterium]|nr:cell envelope integrity protein TolA [Gammaproteobacteria bacterium]